MELELICSDSESGSVFDACTSKRVAGREHWARLGADMTHVNSRCHAYHLIARTPSLLQTSSTVNLAQSISWAV